MDGECSEFFEYFRTLFVRGFLEVRQPRNRERLCLLVNMMTADGTTACRLPCFEGGAAAAVQV